MKITVKIIIITLCIALSISSYAFNLEEKVKSFTLSNGLKVLVVERHASPTVSLYITHRVGAVDERDEQSGMAHFLEHMMFKGTTTIGTRNYHEEKKIIEKIDAVAEAIRRESKENSGSDKEKIEQLRRDLEALQKKEKEYIVESEIDRLYTGGGAVDLNASTGYDLTTYQVSLPSNLIELWARIESDRMKNPAFREFYSERKVIMEERNQSIESNPDRRLTELFLGTAFTVHPYRRPVIGWKENIPRLNKKSMREFFETFYAPSNTVISVVGDVDTETLKHIMERYFSTIPSKAIMEEPILSEPPQEGERRAQLRDNEANPKLIIGYHKPTLPSRDDYVFDVIDGILSRGRTSRLYAKLVKENEIASEVTTVNGFPGARYPNLFVIFATPRYPYTNTELEATIYEELERLKEETVSFEELEKAKNIIKADYIRRLETNAGLASMLAYFEAIAGNYRYLTSFLEVLETITPAEIRAVSKKYLVNTNRTVAELFTGEEQ
ncbi:MAG: insulinase family protein [Deltaproteobacteria bacterium]|nr:insulinase family protein [Deltaproteobacteria bacterium]MBN2845847.1 insulinase family protein [Deltaproteobacteria bacterium]